jgi:hypothetical protein
MTRAREERGGCRRGSWTVADCLAMSHVTKTIPVAETVKKAWPLAEKRYRPMMDF